MRKSTFNPKIREEITIYLLFIGISRENRKLPENFLFCFDFTINSKYVILFHFESNQGGKVALEQEIFRDGMGCNWIQNEIKYLNIFILNTCSS